MHAVQDEWVRTQVEKQTMTASSSGNTYIPPVPTRAALGHAIGAQRYLAHSHGGEEWKMTKFKTVPSKVGLSLRVTGG